MTKDLTHPFGFDHRACRKRGLRYRLFAPIELIATIALAASTAIAATIVSIGIARAEAAGDADGSPFAVAMFLSLLLAGMGGLTAMMVRQVARRDRSN